MNIELSLTVFFLLLLRLLSLFFLIPMGRQVKKGYNKKRELGNLIMPQAYTHSTYDTIRFDTSWYQVHKDSFSCSFFFIAGWRIASSTWNSIKAPDRQDSRLPLGRPSSIFSQVHWNGTKFKLDQTLAGVVVVVDVVFLSRSTRDLLSKSIPYPFRRYFSSSMDRGPQQQQDITSQKQKSFRVCCAPISVSTDRPSVMPFFLLFYI